MQITVNVSEQLVTLAQAKGVPVEKYAEELLAREAEGGELLKASERSSAVDTIRDLRKGSHLGGIKLSDLIHEGHSY